MDGIRNQIARRKSGLSNSQESNFRSPNVERCDQFRVSRRGWLHRLEGGALKQWKRRWFVLGDYCLFYYKDLKEEKLLGSLLLPSYRVSVCDSSEDGITRKFSFKLEHHNMKTYFLAADSKESMTQWMNELMLASNMQFNYGSNSAFNNNQENVGSGNFKNDTRMLQDCDALYGQGVQSGQSTIDGYRPSELVKENELESNFSSSSANQSKVLDLGQTYSGSYNDIGLPPISKCITSLPTNFGSIDPYLSHPNRCNYINAPPKPRRQQVINGENGDIYYPVNNYNSYLLNSAPYNQSSFSSLTNGPTPDLIAHNSSIQNNCNNLVTNAFSNSFSSYWPHSNTSLATLHPYSPTSTLPSSTLAPNYSVPPLSAASAASSSSTSHFLFNQQDISSFHQPCFNQTQLAESNFSTINKQPPRPHSADFLEREQKDEEELLAIKNAVAQNALNFEQNCDANYYSKPKQGHQTNYSYCSNILPVRPKSSLERYDPYFKQNKDYTQNDDLNNSKIQNEGQIGSLHSVTFSTHRPWSDYLKEQNQKISNEVKSSMLTSEINRPSSSNAEVSKKDAPQREESFQRLIEWKRRMLLSPLHKRNKSNESATEASKPAKLRLPTPIDSSIKANSSETKISHERSKSFTQYDTFGLDDEGQHLDNFCTKLSKLDGQNAKLGEPESRNDSNSPDYINVKNMHRLGPKTESSGSFSNLSSLELTRNGGDGQESDEQDQNLLSTLNKSKVDEVSDWNKIGLPAVDSNNISSGQTKFQSSASLLSLDALKLPPKLFSKPVEKTFINRNFDQDIDKDNIINEVKVTCNDPSEEGEKINLNQKDGTELDQVQSISKTLNEDKDYFPPNLVKDRIKNLENRSLISSLKEQKTFESLNQKKESNLSSSDESKDLILKDNADVTTAPFSNLFDHQNTKVSNFYSFASERMPEDDIQKMESLQSEPKTLDYTSTIDGKEEKADDVHDSAQYSSADQQLVSSSSLQSNEAKLSDNGSVKETFYTLNNNEKPNLISPKSCYPLNVTQNQASLLDTNPAYESFSGISGMAKFESLSNPLEAKKEEPKEAEAKPKSTRNVTSAPYYYSDLLSDNDDQEFEEKLNYTLKSPNRRGKLNNFQNSKLSSTNMDKCDLSKRVNLLDLIPEDYGLKFLDAERNKYNAGSTLEKVPENRKIIIDSKRCVTPDSLLEKIKKKVENKDNDEQASQEVAQSQIRSQSLENLDEDHLYENLEALSQLHHKQNKDHESLFDCDYLRRVSQNYFTVDARIGAVMNAYCTSGDRLSREVTKKDHDCDTNLVNYFQPTFNLDSRPPNCKQDLHDKNTLNDLNLSSKSDTKEVHINSLDHTKSEIAFNFDTCSHPMMIQECNQYDYPLSNTNEDDYLLSLRKASSPYCATNFGPDSNPALVSRQELMNKTHDELVLLLIQLRRIQAHLLANCDELRLQLESEEKLMEIEPLRREEHRIRTQELKEKLMEAEQKCDSQYPIIEMVDNMVKLNSPSSIQNSIQDSSLNKNVFKAARSASFSVLNQLANSSKAVNEQLGCSLRSLNSKFEEVDDVTMEQERLIKILEQDKTILDKTLESVRSSASSLVSPIKSPKNVITEEDIKKQEAVLENELEKVRGLLAQSSLRLEEREKENAALEQARSNLNQSLTSLSSFVSESQNVILEEELASIDQAIDDLYAKRQEILENYKKQKVSESSLIIRASPTGLAGSAPLPEKKKKFSTYFETDLDTMESRDLAQIGCFKKHQSANEQQIGPLYENLEKTVLSVSPNSRINNKNGAKLEKGNNQSFLGIEVDRSNLKSDQEKLFNIQMFPNQNKTVRVVKRECEKRRSENLGKLAPSVDGQAEGVGYCWKSHQDYENVSTSAENKIDSCTSNLNPIPFSQSSDNLILNQEMKALWPKSDNNNNNNSNNGSNISIHNNSNIGGEVSRSLSSLTSSAPPDIIKSTIRK